MKGLTFLNTRDAGSAAELTHRLAGFGATVMERPTIAFVPPASWRPFDQRLTRLRKTDWIVFTSTTAVRFALGRISETQPSHRPLDGAQVAAVGAGTARALESAGIAVALVPEHFQGEGLLAALLQHLRPGERAWFPRAETAREVIVEGLREAGIEVEVTPVYRTVQPEGGLGKALTALENGKVDWLVFTSPSTINHFLAMLPQGAREGLSGHGPRVACLGSVTARTAREAGLAVRVVPERQDLDGLVEAIVRNVRDGR